MRSVLKFRKAICCILLITMSQSSFAMMAGNGAGVRAPRVAAPAPQVNQDLMAGLGFLGSILAEIPFTIARAVGRGAASGYHQIIRGFQENGGPALGEMANQQLRGALLGIGGVAQVEGAQALQGLGAVANQEGARALQGLGAVAQQEGAAAIAGMGARVNQEGAAAIAGMGALANQEGFAAMAGLGQGAGREAADFIHMAGVQGNQQLNNIGWTVAKNSTLLAIGVTAVLVSGYYGYKYIQKRIFQPNLAIEESEYQLIRFVKQLLYKDSHPTMKDLVLPPATQDQLVDFLGQLRAAKKNKSARPTLLLYGPPGTGKTAIAKTMAKKDGYTYVFLSGSSFFQFSEDEGLAEMSKLFVWAKRQGNVLIFIDEIETFLGTRDSNEMSEKTRKFLAHFLAHTGERSPSYTIVGATNMPERLDPAVLRRFTNSIEIPLPGIQERKDIFSFYFNKLIFNDKNAQVIKIADEILSVDYFDQLATQTEGLSGADILDIVESTKLLALCLEEPLLSSDIVDKVILRMKDKYKGLHKGQIEKNAD